MRDNVNHPAHYARWPIEAIDLTEREDDAIAYLTSRQEDTTEMRTYLQDQSAAIYDQVKKGAYATWDAT